MNLQFKREHRYFVFKVKNLTQDQQQRLFDFEMELGPRNSVGECVVVESDWPNYQETWDAIRDVSFGTFKPREVLVAERNALAKEVDEANDRIGELTEERDALVARIQTAERVEKIFSETTELTFDDCLKLFADEIREVQTEAIQTGLDAIGAPVTKFANKSDDFLSGFTFCAELLRQHAAKVRQGGE